MAALAHEIDGERRAELRRSMKRRVVYGVNRRWLRMLLLCMSALARFAATPDMACAQTQFEPLIFQTAQGPRTYQVEVMRNDAERARGLMHRRFLPEDRGMLFIFDHPHVVSMWMKNTYIPLDMIFADKSGRIISIARNAEPLSEAMISSKGPTRAVVELNAGAADKMGLREGDAIIHAVFKN